MKPLPPLTDRTLPEAARLRVEQEHLKRALARLNDQGLLAFVKILDGPPELVEATFDQLLALREPMRDVAARLVEVRKKLGGTA